MSKIKVNLLEEKINLINNIHQKELQYWKKTVFKKALDKDEANAFHIQS